MSNTFVSQTLYEKLQTKKWILKNVQAIWVSKNLSVNLVKDLFKEFLYLNRLKLTLFLSRTTRFRLYQRLAFIGIYSAFSSFIYQLLSWLHSLNRIYLYNLISDRMKLDQITVIQLRVILRIGFFVSNETLNCNQF